jgi:hypothetical protein
MRYVPGNSRLELVAADDTTTCDLECSASDSHLRIQANEGVQQLIVEVTSGSATPVVYTSKGDGDAGHSFRTDNGSTQTFVADFGGDVHVGGDIEVSGSVNGLILSSPNGTRFRLTIDNSGTLTAQSL